MSTEQTLEVAVKYHQAGQLREAENLYQQILREIPDHVGVLNLLGVIALQNNNYDLAAQYLNRALALNPNFADAHNHLGIALKEQGRLAEAVASHQRALTLSPNLVAAYINLGNALKQQGNLAEAIRTYEQALRLNPDAMEAYVNLGDALTEMGKPGEATRYLQQALRLNPNVPEAHNNMGNALKELGQPNEAAAHYQQALRLRPNYAETLNNLGTLLQEQDKLTEADACLREALRLNPNFAKAHNNLGIVLGLEKKPAEAEHAYREAIRLIPNFAEAHYNLAHILHLQGKLDEALASTEQALRLRPDYPEAQSHLGILSLLRGDFDKGWPAYEWRWKTRPLAPFQRHFPQPVWQGTRQRGSTIFLYAEQGFGDAMQFVRFAQIAKERCGTVLVECPSELRRILSTCPGVDRVLSVGEPPPRFDVHASLMSLPYILHTTLTTIPATTPYLFAAPGLVEQWKQELSRFPGFKIGIVWQGNPKYWNPHLKATDLVRSVRLAQFEPIARQPGVHLVSLQKGFGSEQIAEMKERFAVADLSTRLNDFMDTAAVIKNLDLVITVDTAVAHLAGALGVPTWVALPYVPDWRWLLQRQDSPWYPTLRLFRQSRTDAWDDVFVKMSEALARR